MKFNVGTISAEVREAGGVYHGAASRAAEPEVGLYDASVLMTAADGWVGEFAVVHFPIAGMLMGRFVFTGGAVAAPYDRLNTAGSTTVKELNGKWIVPVKVMRKNGRDYPTLNRVNENELDGLVEGSFRDILGQFGDFALKRHGDIDPTAGKQIINGLGLQMDAGNNALLGAMIAVTRPLALVRGLP